MWGNHCHEKGNAGFWSVLVYIWTMWHEEEFTKYSKIETIVLEKARMCVLRPTHYIHHLWYGWVGCQKLMYHYFYIYDSKLSLASQYLHIHCLLAMCLQAILDKCKIIGALTYTYVSSKKKKKTTYTYVVYYNTRECSHKHILGLT